MKSNRKAQGAMEYLMTYGWAIIVVMIVGLALWNLGVLNLGKTYPKGFSGFSGVRPLDWCVDERATISYNLPDGQSRAMLRMISVNAEGVPVKLLVVEAKGQCTTSPDGLAYGEYTLIPSVNIEPNAVGRIMVSKEDIGDAIDDNPDINHIICNNVALGEPYKFQLLITYNKTIDKGLSVIHKSVGNIWGTFESNCPGI